MVVTGGCIRNDEPGVVDVTHEYHQEEENQGEDTWFSRNFSHDGYSIGHCEEVVMKYLRSIIQCALFAEFKKKKKKKKKTSLHHREAN